MLQAGGILVNEHVTRRIFSGCSVERDDKPLYDFEIPIKVAWLRDVSRFELMISRSMREQYSYITDMAITLELSIFMIAMLVPGDDQDGPLQRELMHMLETIRHQTFSHRSSHRYFDAPPLIEVLAQSGLIGQEVLHEHMYEQEGLYRSVQHPSEPGDWLASLSFTIERLGFGERKSRGFAGYSRLLRPVLLRIMERGRGSGTAPHLLEQMAAILDRLH